MRFDEYEALERSFEDAIAEIRYEYYEEIERRQSTGGTADVTNDEGSKAHSSSEKHPEGTKAYIAFRGNYDNDRMRLLLLRNFNFSDHHIDIFHRY